MLSKNRGRTSRIHMGSRPRQKADGGQDNTEAPNATFRRYTLPLERALIRAESWVIRVAKNGYAAPPPRTMIPFEKRVVRLTWHRLRRNRILVYFGSFGIGGGLASFGVRSPLRRRRRTRTVT